jgi:hypothetical protein
MFSHPWLPTLLVAPYQLTGTVREISRRVHTLGDDLTAQPRATATDIMTAE